jgi:hypothetical protein
MPVPMPGISPPQGANLAIDIHQTAQANISAFVAGQKVTRFVVTEISTQLLADTPELVVGERTCWSVPVILTSPSRGLMGKVGDILVDVTTGELLVDDENVRRITENARRLAERSPL